MNHENINEAIAKIKREFPETVVIEDEQAFRIEFNDDTDYRIGEILKDYEVIRKTLNYVVPFRDEIEQDEMEEVVIRLKITGLGNKKFLPTDDLSEDIQDDFDDIVNQGVNRILIEYAKLRKYQIIKVERDPNGPEEFEEMNFLVTLE